MAAIKYLETLNFSAKISNYDFFIGHEKSETKGHFKLAALFRKYFCKNKNRTLLLNL